MREGARPDPRELGHMVDTLAHRGPDDRGIHISGPLGLAQVRLSIIGLATGHQPMVSENGDLALVANGEVYNYVELNALLSKEGYSPRTGSDSETILNAYAAHGMGFLSELRGMYAFVLGDGKKGHTILVRDRLGIKPLFYVRLSDRIAFASEIKALLKILPERAELVPSALRQFLQNQFSSGKDTPIKGVKRVLPGQALIIDRALKITSRRYWSAATVKPRDLSPEEASEELGLLMDAATREHMRSDVPIGLFLSGGVDSATLAAMLHARGAGPVRSFSVGFKDTAMADELDAAARIAIHFGLDHTPLRLDLRRVFGRIPHAIWAADELMRDYACLPTSILAETVSKHLKVVFSGEGGDEVFAGYRRYCPRLPERWFKGMIKPGSGGFRTRGQWNLYWRQRLFGSELSVWNRAEREPIIQAWKESPSAWSDLQRRQYVDLTTALPDNLLVKTDRMLMGFGVEGRVPFLDHRVVEFGLSLPDGLKVRGYTGKWLLKQWAKPHLPAGYLNQPKRGFHVPVGDWLRGERLVQLGDRLAKNRGVRDWFKVEAVGELIGAGRVGRNVSREIWGLMQFAIWHRLFIEQPGLKPAPDEDPLEWIASSP